MTFSRFLVLLLLFTVSTILINLAFLVMPFPIKNYLEVAWWTLGFFIVTSLFLYFLGRNAALSSNKMLFNQVIMLSVFIKMFTALAVLFMYKKMYQPQGKAFLIPFFVVYFIFIIFETYFMIKLGKTGDK